MKLTISNLVKDLLTNFPHLRNSDERLIATVWYHQAGLKEKQMSAVELLNLYIDKQLSSPESIRRSRQKIQELNPELRGVVYNKRHTEQQRETLNELNSIQ